MNRYIKKQVSYLWNLIHPTQSIDELNFVIKKFKMSRIIIGMFTSKLDIYKLAVKDLMIDVCITEYIHDVIYYL